MLPKNESNDSHNSIHTVIEETNVKSDAPSEDFLQNSITTGTSPLIHWFYEFSLFTLSISNHDQNLDSRDIAYVFNTACLVFRQK